MGKCVLVLAPTTLFVGGCYGVLVGSMVFCVVNIVLWSFLWCSESILWCFFFGGGGSVLRSNYGVLGCFLWCSDWLLWCFGSGCSDQDFFQLIRSTDFLSWGSAETYADSDALYNICNNVNVTKMIPYTVNIIIFL